MGVIKNKQIKYSNVSLAKLQEKLKKGGHWENTRYKKGVIENLKKKQQKKGGHWENAVWKKGVIPEAHDADP